MLKQVMYFLIAGLVMLIALCFVCFLCLIVISVTGIVPNIGATSTAEARLTATILALTPSNTPTMTLTPSITPTPSRTFTPTDTLIASPTRAITLTRTSLPTNTTQPSSTSSPSSSRGATTEIRYIAGSSSTVNVRAEPNRDATQLGFLTFGTQISVIDEENGWYQIQFNGQTGWILGTLTTSSPPQANALPPSTGSNNSSSVEPTPIQESTIPSSIPTQVVQPSGGVFPCEGNFDFSVCSNYSRPSSCAEAVAMGIPERDVACCFPARDGNKNGYACYGR